MESIKERNFANIFADFSDLTAIIESFGSDYNPARTDITKKELDNANTEAVKIKANMHVLLQAFKSEIVTRESSFATLNQITTRAINALKVYPIANHTYENARALVHLIQGNGKKHNHTNPPADPNIISPGNESMTNGIPPADPTTPNNYTSHQMSYDMRLENLLQFITLLAGVPEYIPNEEDLKVANLKAYYDKLNALNQAVIKASIAYGKVKMQINEFMFNESAGLAARALASKAYIKSIFGAKSPEYMKVSGLSFPKKIK